MASSIWSRGPTTRARVIGTGLSIQGTLELLDEPLDRTFNVRVGLRRQGGRLPAAPFEERCLLLREGALRFLQDLLVSLLRLDPEHVLELQGLPARGAEDPLLLREGLVLRPSDPVLDVLDAVESLLPLHQLRSP